MSEADEDDLKIHKANVQKADSVEIYGPEDLEDYTDHGRTGSYDLDHRDLDHRDLDQRDLDHQLVDHIQRTRRESIASIFTISKNELKRVPSLVNLEAHKVCTMYILSTSLIIYIVPLLIHCLDG